MLTSFWPPVHFVGFGCVSTRDKAMTRISTLKGLNLPTLLDREPASLHMYTGILYGGGWRTGREAAGDASIQATG